MHRVFAFSWSAAVASAGVSWLLMLQASPPLTADFPHFVDIAGKVGLTAPNISGIASNKDYILEATGSGAAFFDYDNDGDVDLLIANGSTLEKYKKGGDSMFALYENRSGAFADVTRKAVPPNSGWASGACVADFDNDGHQDFYITNLGPNVLYRNNGNGTFKDVTSRSGTGNAGWGTGCAFGDYDRDGNVDLYVANYAKFDEKTVPRRSASPLCRYMGVDVFCGPRGMVSDPDVLYRNNGDGTFTDVSLAAGIRDSVGFGFAVSFSDLNNDGWLDIYVANDSTTNFLFKNNRNGAFSEVGLLSGTALGMGGNPQASMGLAIGDYDGNGLFDIFVTNFSGDTDALYQNQGGMQFTYATASSGMGQTSFSYLGWGDGFVDLDNDGLLDIWVTNGHVYPEIDSLNSGERFLQRKELFRNVGNGRFQEIAPVLGGDLIVGRSGRGTAFGDFDNDGDIDVVVVNLNNRPSLYRNEGGTRNHWITMKLVGTKGNRDAIGARVEIDAGGRTQVSEVRSGESYLSQNDMRIHFGLGGATVVDTVRIRWPNGTIETLSAPLTADQFVTVREGAGVVQTAR